MATLTFTTLKKITKTMPVFNFIIPQTEFYINTPGISISSGDGLTYEADGKFFILNTNAKTIYFNDISFVKAQVRDPLLRSRLDLIKVTENRRYQTETKQYIEYNVKNNGQYIGFLTIVTDLNNIGSNKPIIPLTKLGFSAFYQVQNIGALSYQYYGKSTNDPNKNVGIIDFTFNLKCYSDSNFLNEINENVVISTILVNT